MFSRGRQVVYDLLEYCFLVMKSTTELFAEELHSRNKNNDKTATCKTLSATRKL